MRPTRPDWHAWPQLIRAAVPFGIVTFALGLSYRFDTVLLSILQGDEATGHYRAAYNLIFTLVIFSNVINTALYPSLTRQAATNPERLAGITTRILRYLLALALPMAAGGFLLARPLVDTLYSAEQYGDSVRALEVLIWTLPFMYASELLGYVVLITNREKLVARAVVVSTALNVVLNLLLVPRYGLIAASLMTVMTEAVLVAQHLWNLRPLTQAIDWVQAFVRPLLATVVMGVAINLAGAWLPWWSLIGVGAVVYAVAGYALGVFRLDDLRVFQRNRGKVAEA